MRDFSKTSTGVLLTRGELSIEGEPELPRRPGFGLMGAHAGPDLAIGSTSLDVKFHMVAKEVQQEAD